MKYLKNNIRYLAISIFLFICLGLFVYFIDPEKNFLSINPSIIGLLLAFGAVSSLGIFLLKNIRRGILLGIFISSILILRFLGFNDLLYIGIILLVLLLIEAFFFQKPKKHRENKESLIQ